MADTTIIISQDANELIKSIYPISFRILNDKHEEKIYLENKPSSGILELKNKSGTDIYFAPQDTKAMAGPENFHLALRFRPGILKSDVKSLIKNRIIKKGWVLSIGLINIESSEVKNSNTEEQTDVELKESTPVLYFLNTDKTVFGKNKTILLPLKHLHLDCEEGTQVTQVELLCNSLCHTPDYLELIKSHIGHFNLTIINHRGNPYMPIHVGFTGFNTILNNGSPNTLNLRITNLQKKTPENKGVFTISHHKRSKIYLYFNTDAESGDNVLANINQVSGIELEILIPYQRNEASLEHEPMFQGDTPVWEIFPQDGDVVLQPHLTVLDKNKITKLPDDSCFDITLSNIVTNYLMGVTNLYLRLENMPGYWDHTYTIPISKQPMVFAKVGNEERVGIGTANPTNILSVKGGADFSGTVNAKDYALTGVNANGPIPKGGIIMWSGAINAIPTGWALCDGKDGRPDLMDKFIIGAGKKYSPNSFKDSDEVQLTTNELPTHNHSINISNSGSHWHKALFDTGGGGAYGNSPDATYMWKDGDSGSGLQGNNPLANGFTPTTINGDHTHSASINYAGNGKPFKILPPYFALAFIIKI